MANGGSPVGVHAGQVSGSDLQLKEHLILLLSLILILLSLILIESLWQAYQEGGILIASGELSLRERWLSKGLLKHNCMCIKSEVGLTELKEVFSGESIYRMAALTCLWQSWDLLRAHRSPTGTGMVLRLSSLGDTSYWGECASIPLLVRTLARQQHSEEGVQMCSRTGQATLFDQVWCAPAAGARMHCPWSIGKFSRLASDSTCVP